MPTCCDCSRTLAKAAFAKSQLKKKPDARRCQQCAHALNGTDTGTGTDASCTSAGSTSKRTASSTDTSDGQADPPSSGAASSRLGGTMARGATPPIEPGREAIVRNLRGRTELNGTGVTIVKVLPTGRVAVKIERLPGTPMAHTETVAVRPENLEVVWGLGTGTGTGDADGTGASTDTPGNGMHYWGIEPEECPICMDAMMNTGEGRGQSASMFSCCGGKICNKCFFKMQENPNDRDRCPLCRADTSDCSDAAELKRVRIRADRGDPSAMYNLGGYYDFGRMGIRQNQRTARVWYEKAALKGHSRAANNLACSHRDGEGGPVNPTEAARWFRVAAEMGHVQAATNLGLALMRGDGVKTDLKEAEVWLKKSADAGDELAVQQMGILDMMKSMNNASRGRGRSRGGVNVNVTPFGSGGSVAFSFGE
mmetsp:Transcript_33111/g.72609  ORF Transcript_33111/g.72609 Transcript_33111/m.72609 type:complete len:424 (-) Transcript_33111:200-1471(-)